MLNKPLAHQDVSSARDGDAKDGELFQLWPILQSSFASRVAATASLVELVPMLEPQPGVDSLVATPATQGEAHIAASPVSQVFELAG